MISGICVWFLSLSVMPLSFIHGSILYSLWCSSIPLYGCITIYLSFSCSHFLAVLNNSDINIHVRVFVRAWFFSSFECVCMYIFIYTPRNRIAGSCDNFVFNSSRYHQTGFHSGSTVLHSHYKCVSVLIFLHSFQHFCQFSSVTQSCLTLRDRVDYITPGLPIHHQLLELTQTHVHWVGDAIQPSHPLLSPSPPALLGFPSIRVFFSKSVLHIRWPKYWSFSFSNSPANEFSGLISFRIDWLYLLAVQETLKSLLQHHSSEASTL